MRKQEKMKLINEVTMIIMRWRWHFHRKDKRYEKKSLKSFFGGNVVARRKHTQKTVMVESWFSLNSINSLRAKFFCNHFDLNGWCWLQMNFRKQSANSFVDSLTMSDRKTKSCYYDTNWKDVGFHCYCFAILV